MILSIPEKHVPLVLEAAKFLCGDAAHQEGGMGVILDGLRKAVAAAVPNVTRRRSIEVDIQTRVGLMLVVGRIAETASPSAKHWAERARSKLVGTDPATAMRVTL